MSMTRKVYMLIDNTKYQLPLVIADTAQELADIVGVKRNSIHSAICRLKSGELKTSKYICCEIDEEDFE